MSEEESKRGRGRPPKNSPYTHQTVFRYDDSHDHYLKTLSENMGKSQSEVLRIALRTYYNINKGNYNLE